MYFYTIQANFYYCVYEDSKNEPYRIASIAQLKWKTRGKSVLL